VDEEGDDDEEESSSRRLRLCDGGPDRGEDARRR
jgi:hypothetical protein